MLSGFLFEDDDVAQRRARYLVRMAQLRTLSQRHGAYAKPVYGIDSPEYAAYYAGFYLGNSGQARPSTPYDTDSETRYYIDGFRIGALLRPREIMHEGEDSASTKGPTRTRDGTLLSEEFGKTTRLHIPTRSVAR